MARPIKLSPDPSHTESWLKPLGKLVVNFAAIELYTYWWLGALGGSQRSPRDSLRVPFSRRVEDICGLLRQNLKDEALRTKCIEAWHQALDIAKFRNALVHNPIVFGWTSGSQQGPPDFVGIPDVAHLGQKPPATDKIASLSDVNTKVNELAALGAHLYELLTACDGALASEKTSHAGSPSV